MPRKLGGEYPGALYHVMSRADGSKGRILLSDVDGQDFLRSLAEARRPERLRACLPAGKPLA